MNQLNLARKIQAATSSCESIQEIINIAATAEALAVAAMGAALVSAQAGTLALDEEQQQVVAASRAAEQAHYDFLVAAGAEALTLDFTLPDPMILSDVGVFLQTVIGLEEAFIGAYIAAAETFSEQGMPDLVTYAMQTVAVEGEHRAHARYYALTAGLISEAPNNHAFEKALFGSVGEAAQALTDLGWIGGTGPAFSYPGELPVDSSLLVS